MADVASLDVDGTVQAWDRWMGCILCPGLADPAGNEEKVNLIEKGGKGSFLQTKERRRCGLFAAGNRGDLLANRH